MTHVWTLRIRINGLAILLARRWRRWVKDRSSRVRGTDGVVVAIGCAAVGAMLWVHGPRTLMAAMLHALRWRLRLDVDADTGRTGALGFRH